MAIGASLPTAFPICNVDDRFYPLNARQARLRCCSAQHEHKANRLRCQNTSSRPDVRNNDESVHFIGIGGAGLSALALFALKQGWDVSGSDLASSERLEWLQSEGAKVYLGHDASHLSASSSCPPAAVVVSSAVAMDNVEVEEAKRVGIRVWKRDEWLGKITADKELIAVAGSHGKSSTTAMLAVCLKALGHDVSAIVGAEVPQFPDGGNAMVGNSSLFVLEADEYDGCFLGVQPLLAVVTNCEWEHVDIFPNEASVRAMFRRFAQQVRPNGTLLLCADEYDPHPTAPDYPLLGSQTDAPDNRQVVTYGLSHSCDWRAMLLAPNPQGGTDFVVVHGGRPMARVALRQPGTHNVLNSLAVIAVASILAMQDLSDGGGSDAEAAGKRAADAAAQCLGGFEGVRRRFEFVGRARGCAIFDDYAHHPTEVRATLQAARQRFDVQPLWVVFQPHTYSRLAHLLPDFAPSFSAADRVIVTEVYAAREEKSSGVSSEDLAALITGPPAVYVPSLDDALERLAWEITVQDANAEGAQRGEIIVLTLGAGDVGELGPRLLRKLAKTSS